MESSGLPPKGEKKKFKKVISVVLVIIVAGSVLIGVYVAHVTSVNNALSPSNLLLDPTQADTILPHSIGVELPSLPSSGNIGGVDYYTGAPAYVYGKVTTPNIIVIIIKNQSNSSALSGFNSLKDGIAAKLPSSIGTNVSEFNISGYPYTYFAFFNEKNDSGAIVSVVWNYIVITAVYNLPVSTLVNVTKMQATQISNEIQYVHTHYLL